MISQSRFSSRYAGLNAVSKKVYAAAPIAESWTVAQICAELARLGTPMDVRIIHGSLSAMTDAGLIREPQKNHYVREAVRAVIAKQTTPTTMEIAMTKANTETKIPATKPATSAKALTPMDQLGDLAQRVTQLSAEMSQIAEDISEAIIVAQVQQEADAAELAQLRQLKALLKGLGMSAV